MAMKIAYDYQIFALQEYGGISRYFYELARNLALSNTCDVMIIAPSYINKYINDINNGLVFGKYLPIIKGTYRIRKYLNIFITKNLLYIKHPDIVHETYYNLLKLARPNAKVVVTVYDMIHEKYSEYFPSNDETIYIKSKAINRADHVICISENTRNDLIKLTNIHKSKTSIVHLGVDIINLIKIKKKMGGRPFILYVGHRDGYKNFQRFLKSYFSSKRLLRDFDLVCFGGPEFSSDELTSLNRLGLTPGQVRRISGNDEVLAHLYSNAAALIYPSIYEGFGIPLLEAMAYQCPVVCSNTSSMPEVAGNAAEYFNPYEVDSIVGAIESVVYSSEKSSSLISLGLTRIKLFSWEKCAKQTYEIYSSLL